MAAITAGFSSKTRGVWKKGFTPMIVTDSPLLAEWETAELYAEVDGIPGGVLVKVFRKDNIS